MKKFLSLSVFFLSILLVVIPQKTSAQTYVCGDDFCFENDDNGYTCTHPYHINILNETVVIGQNVAVAIIVTQPGISPITSPGQWEFAVSINGTDFNYAGWFADIVITNDTFYLSDNFSATSINLSDLDSVYIKITNSFFFSDSLGNPALCEISQTWKQVTGNTITSIPNSLMLGKNDFLLYPNPATDILTIEHPGASEKTGPNQNQTEIRIFDLTGNLICATSSVAQSRKQTISVADFPSGIYFLQIGDQTKRFEIVGK